MMIYVHIPFCDSKCYYCNFCSAKYTEDIKEKYFNKLFQEIKLNSNKNNIISSIYFGGGTPSSVDEKYIKNTLKLIRENFKVKKDAEITIEANPCSITQDKLLIYKDIGINRLSIGVQSLNNKSLKTIGRKHNKKQAINAIKLAKKCGFNNINCDILIGIPNQNYFSLFNSVKKLIKLNIQHISAYMLINEKGTKLTNLIEQGKVKVASEDKSVIYYNKLTSYLKSKGYNRYEISNFCKQGFECKHNLGYWDLTEYYGFGLSAHSYVFGCRYSNGLNMQEYLNFDFDYKKEKLSNAEQIEELIMLGLRTAKGVSIKDLNVLGYDILNQKQDTIKMLLSNGFIQVTDNFICLTNNSFGVTNQIILKLLP